jgi:hypothetical protein
VRISAELSACVQEYEQPMPGLLYEAELSGSSSSSRHTDSEQQRRKNREHKREQNSLSDSSSDAPQPDLEGPGVGLITASSVTVSGITVDSVTGSSSADGSAAATAAAAHTSCEDASLLDKSAHTASTASTTAATGGHAGAGTTIDIGSGVVLRRTSSSSGAHSDQYEDDEHEHKSIKVNKLQIILDMLPPPCSMITPLSLLLPSVLSLLLRVCVLSSLSLCASQPTVTLQALLLIATTCCF